MTKKDIVDVTQQAAIAHTNAVLKRARTIHYSLFAGNIYSLLGLFSLRDVDFFAGGKSVRLPLFPADVPTTMFCIIAPGLLLLTYFYQDYYLRDLFHRLNSLPVRQRDGTLIGDLIEPWVMSRRTICKRNSKPGRWLTAGLLDRGVFTASYSLSLLLTPGTLFLFWIWTFSPHSLGLSFWLLALFAGAVCSCLVNFKLNFLTSDCALFLFRPIHAIGTICCLGIIVAGLGIYTFGKVGGWANPESQIAKLIPLYSADLSGAQLVKQPANWQRRKNAILRFLKVNFSIEYASKNIACMTVQAKRPEWCVTEEGPTHEQWNTAVETFRVERFSYLRSLPRVDLKDFDLRRADLTDAFLVNVDAAGTNFSGAQMKRAILEGAQLPGANLSEADLTFADFSNTDISSINLIAAAIYGADFTDFIMRHHNEGMKNQQVFEYAYGDLATKIHSDRVHDFNHSIPTHWALRILKEGDYDPWYMDWFSSQNDLFEKGQQLIAEGEKLVVK